VLTHETLLEEALGLYMAKARAEVAFGVTRSTVMRARGGGNRGSGLWSGGHFGMQSGQMKCQRGVPEGLDD
jgi:hypothetical protein